MRARYDKLWCLMKDNRIKKSNSGENSKLSPYLEPQQIWEGSWGD